MTRLQVPAESLRHTEIVKRSRFLCELTRIDSPADATAQVARLRAEFPDASHVCQAWIAGRPGHTTALGCSDDGEPAGTAGKPMLKVLEHGGVSFIGAAVVRWFGGTKLGTGGLARAYGQAVVVALHRLPLAERRELETLRVRFDYPLEARARHLLAACEGEVLSIDYSDRITLEARLDADRCRQWLDSLRDAAGGQLALVEPPD